jgi:hypothetical protein
VETIARLVYDAKLAALSAREAVEQGDAEAARELAREAYSNYREADLILYEAAWHFERGDLS